MEIELQPVWRTLSKTNGSGFFVWEVVQVMNGPNVTPEKYFDICLDSSFIYAQCMHFWTLERAEEYLKENTMSEYQLVTIIGEK